jgi:hypothetical protein
MGWTRNSCDTDIAMSGITRAVNAGAGVRRTALKTGDRRESDHYSVEIPSLGAWSQKTKVFTAKNCAVDV